MYIPASCKGGILLFFSVSDFVGLHYLLDMDKAEASLSYPILFNNEMVVRFPEELSDTNKSGVAFLLTDLDVAMTFMDVAETSQIPETVTRNHKNARIAYETVLRLLPNLRPDAAQRKAIDDKLAALKARLQAVGQQF